MPPMATDKLTDKAIRAAKTKPKDYKLADGGGMYLLVRQSGAKYWRLKYRFAGKEKTLALGVYCDQSGKVTGDNIKLAKARKLRDEAKILINEGIDPSLERKKSANALHQKQLTTFEAVAHEWLALKKHEWSGDHAHDVQRSLELDVFPDLGQLPITDIDSPLLLKCLERIQKRNALETTKRIRQRCSGIFRFAQIKGLCTEDPAEPLKDVLLSPKPKHLAAVPLEEFPALLKALDNYECEPLTRYATNLLMLTFVRTGELIGARWEEIDFKKEVWTIPAERMKRKREHFVPLSTQAMDLLKSLNNITGHRDYLFPKRGKPREHMSNATILRVIERIGYKGRMTGHGFRTLASTALNESQQFNSDAIEQQLSHEESNEVRAAYNRAKHKPERIKIMQWWADYIENNRSSY